MKQAAIHVRCNAAGKVRYERRNGRETMIVPSFTLKSDIIMNRIKYPHDEIEKSYKGLERTPAPLGHPQNADGSFLSAFDPEAFVRNGIFAWNENVRRDGDRIALDKVIDVARANECEGGKRVLAAIEANKPIHTSTGLMCMLEEAEADDHDFIARDIVWNHDAILLDEPGAATPDQGVGMLVNGQKVEVINSTLEDRADREMDWAVEAVERAIEAKAKVPMRDRIKKTLLSLLGAGEGEASEEQPALNKEDANMAFTPEEKTALEEKVENLTAKLNKLTGDDVADQLKATNEAIEKINARFQAEDDAKAVAAEAEKTDLEEKVANAKLMTPEAAKAAPIEALRVLANTIQAPTAAPIFGGYLNQQAAPDLADMFPKEG